MNQGIEPQRKLMLMRWGVVKNDLQQAASNNKERNFENYKNPKNNRDANYDGDDNGLW